jgi:molybdopterin-guanine dinucleotide biosynthesis protein A
MNIPLMNTFKGSAALLGIVLCGGESKRMGRDKGLLTWPAGYEPVTGESEIPSPGSPTWAGRAAGLLEGLGIAYVFSVNVRQQETYGALFGEEKLVTDNLDLPGPLEGILSTHQQYPDRDLLPLACDMIRMDQRTLEGLIDAYMEERPADPPSAPPIDFYVYRLEGNDFAEPFPGIYCAEALERIYQRYREGAFPFSSLQKVLRTEGHTRYLRATGGDVFSNVNRL